MMHTVPCRTGKEDHTCPHPHQPSLGKLSCINLGLTLNLEAFSSACSCDNLLQENHEN
jgi:hypothetical protein